jgi:arsenate reductase
MAEGLLRDIAGERFEVMSAGVAPAGVRPEAIEVMREVGVDISHHRSKSIDEYKDQPFDYVITVCDNARQQCPVLPGPAERIHWGLHDPAEVTGDEDTRLRAFRDARDELRKRLQTFSEIESRD